VPWVLIPGLDPSNREDMCFTTEAFCGTFGEVPLSEADPVEFLEQAVRFCNERLWGTLSASILVHPRSLRNPQLAEAVERALSDLRYGTVALNAWHAVGFAATSTTWGAYPGHTLEDIQSGTGVVANTLMFSRAQKTVVRGRWRLRPKPPWFLSSRASAAVCKRMTEFEAAPSWRKLPGMTLALLRG
jgi:hypothetical protein